MDTPQKTAGHIDGARDAQHEGESGSENMQAIRENESEVDAEELERQEQGPANRTRAGNPLEEQTIRSAYADEDMSVMEFLDMVDVVVNAHGDRHRDHDEQFDDLEEEIEKLRGRVDELEHGMGRALGYIQLMAERHGDEEIVESMIKEGFV